MSTTSKHPNSKVITIFRAGSILSRAQGAQVDDFFSSSKQSIGSYFDNTNSHKIGNGLTFQEEAMLMPLVIDIPSDDKEFRKKISEYFAELTINVPHGTGIQLEIGLDADNTKDIKLHDSKGQGGNMPLNLVEYIKYRFAKRHPWVAATKEEAEGDQTKVFYIFDKTNVQAKNSTKIKETDAAMQIYLKVKGELAIVDQMLTLLGTDPRSFTGKHKDDLKVEALRDKAVNDPKKFSEVYDGGDLEIRYTIQTMYNTEVLKKIGTRTLKAEDDALIGNTDEETVWWFKDDTNSSDVVVLKARMQEALDNAPAPVGSRKTQVGKTK